MGIRNREGALYIATGVDNTGLYAGRREAMGIIKAMASQITSFDVFSGIGIINPYKRWRLKSETKLEMLKY